MKKLTVLALLALAGFSMNARAEEAAAHVNCKVGDKVEQVASAEECTAKGGEVVAAE